MEYKSVNTFNIYTFVFWSGARDRIEALLNNCSDDDIMTVEQIICDYCDTYEDDVEVEDVVINDFVWFSLDEILQDEHKHIYNKMYDIKDMSELSLEELLLLRSEITLNSLMLKDFKNSLGIEPQDVCEFFNGYMEELQDIATSEGFVGDVLDIIEKYDTQDNLYNYYLSVEF